MCVKNIFVNGMMGIKGLRKIWAIFLLMLCLFDFGKFYALGFEDYMSGNLNQRIKIVNLEKNTMGLNGLKINNIEKCEGFCIYEVSNVKDVEVEFNHISGITWYKNKGKYCLGFSGDIEKAKHNCVKYLPNNEKFGKFQNSLYIEVESGKWCQVYWDGENLSFNEIPNNEIDEFKKFIKDLEDYGVNIYYSSYEDKEFKRVKSDIEITQNDDDSTYNVILSVKDGLIPKEAKYIKVAVNELPYVLNGEEKIELDRTSTLVKVVINSSSDESSDKEEFEEELEKETAKESKTNFEQSTKVRSRTKRKVLGNSLSNSVELEENEIAEAGTESVKEVKKRVRTLGESVTSLRDLKKYKNENEFLHEKIRKLKRKYDALDDRFKEYRRRRSRYFNDDEDKTKKLKSGRKYENSKKDVVDDSDADLKRKIKSKNVKNYRRNIDDEINDEDFNTSISNEFINSNDDKQWEEANKKKAKRGTKKRSKSKHNAVDDEDDFKIFNIEENNYNEDLTNKDDLTLVKNSIDVSNVQERQNEEDTYSQNQQEKTEKTISTVYLSSLFLALSTIFTYDKFGWLRRLIKF